MRITYLAPSTLISDSANSVHVMRMCDAFARLGHDVMLHGHRGKGSGGDVLSYYGVENESRKQLQT